ncbi:MAG: oligoendopeptidase F, partial [Desulfobacterales bacterium]|nr:oligoendopeptidase F [Desulfobacterales bacterium]
MHHAPDQHRKDVSQADCWNLTPLFTAVEDWESLYTDLENRIPDYGEFKDSLGKTVETLKACLDFDHGMGRDLEKIYTYAHLKNDQDKTDGDADSLFQRAMNLYTRISDAGSFIIPQIQAIPEDTLAGYLADPAIADYKFYLEKIIRKIPHTRNAETE